MADKKQRTTKQQAKHYGTLATTCFIAKFPVVFAPYIAIGIANYNKYFVEYNGTKMSISFVLALAVMGVAIYLISKKKLEGSFITLLIGWALFAFIFTMLGQMITDIAMIMWFGLIGLVAAYGLDEAEKKLKVKQQKLLDAINEAEKEITVEKYKTEIKQEQQEKKTVKIKIKK